MGAWQGQGDHGLAHRQGLAAAVELADPVGLGLQALARQGDPQHPSAPYGRQAPVKQGITGWNHHQAFGVEGSGDLALGLGDRLAASQTADVGRTHVGNHGEIRFATAAKPPDFAQAPHAHLHDHGPVLGRGLEQGQGHADVVVFVALAGPHGTPGGQHGAEQLPGGGFAGRTGHRQHRDGQLAAPEQAQLLVGRQGVVHQPAGQARGDQPGLIPLHQGRLGPKAGGFGQKAMAVEAFAHQGHKQAAGTQLAAVGADGA